MTPTRDQEAQTMSEKAYVTTEQMLALHPCWCGRPAVEVISVADSTGDYRVRTQGYCETHCQQTETRVVRKRIDR